MVVNDFPQVHAARVPGTISHLIGAGADTEHVFLKGEACKIPAEFSIIRDIDVVVTDVETLAKYMHGNKRNILHITGTTWIFQPRQETEGLC